jgi:hypothetical protein
VIISFRAQERAAGQPALLRSFDPLRIAQLEYKAWVGYYQRRWFSVLAASIGLVRTGFGMSWPRTLYGAWLGLRAIQLWAPTENDPDKCRATMRNFYALVKLTYGKPDSPRKAAELEVEWWRVHREVQYSVPARLDDEELIGSLTRLYSYLYDEPEAVVRTAAEHRVRAMDLSDQWIAEGCHMDSPLLPQEHAALVRSYAALLAAVHH